MQPQDWLTYTRIADREAIHVHPPYANQIFRECFALCIHDQSSTILEMLDWSLDSKELGGFMETPLDPPLGVCVLILFDPCPWRQAQRGEWGVAMNSTSYDHVMTCI